ncbi:aminotransferase class III-fold pyridoxal phosphate-dependent enzyme [Cupriavidus basilensis]
MRSRGGDGRSGTRRAWRHLCRQPAGGGFRAGRAGRARKREPDRARQRAGQAPGGPCLESLRSGVPQIAEVRGVGAMVAVEFRKADGSPDADFTRTVQNRALEQGLLLLSCGIYGNVIRFLFPLTISDAVMDEGLDILAGALTR